MFFNISISTAVETGIQMENTIKCGYELLEVLFIDTCITWFKFRVLRRS